ncbi:MAG: pseudouridine synthase [bacterium]|nr:pseudouridine synthase [bacterium]
MEEIRINKYLADKGMASRREVDKLIQAGKVFVNGEKALLGQKVKDTDEVTLQRKARVQMERNRQYLLFNKPKGIVTVNAQKGEQSIQDILKLDKGVVPIGRLDKESTGLILLTNDGRVTKKLLSPDSKQEKEYVVSVNKRISDTELKSLEDGLTLEDGLKTKPAKTKRLATNSFSITIQEGKRHQIRRMLAALRLEVKSLKRVRIANLILGSLAPGKLTALSKQESKDFLAFLGLR